MSTSVVVVYVCWSVVIPLFNWSQFILNYSYVIWWFPFFANIIWKLSIYNHLWICNIYDVIFFPSSPVLDEMPIKGLRFLSQSTDSLTRTNQVTESMESLTDEGQYLQSPFWTQKTAADQPRPSECKSKWMKIWYLYIRTKFYFYPNVCVNMS